MSVPGNVGQESTETQYFSPELRLVMRQAEPAGFIEYQVHDADGNVQWARVPDRQFDLGQAQQLAGALRKDALTEQQIKDALDPLITPMPEPEGPMVPGTPPLSDEARAIVEGNLTTPAQPQQGPTLLPGRPAEPVQTLDDSIMTSQGRRDPRLPITQTTTGTNGLRVQSNPKHTLGNNPRAGRGTSQFTRAI
jgi:hypothetical protein